MGTKYTVLSLVNFSGKDIAATKVTIDKASNWDSGNARPDLNFTGPLANGDARCEHQEISTSTKDGCWFTIEVTFTDDSTLSFRANQWDAMPTQKEGEYTTGLQKSGSNEHLCVFQITGEDRYRYSNAYYIRQAKAPDNSNWMGRLLKINSTVLLNQITMPGSHDAGMYTDVTEKARTQNFTILKQLEAGVRYFDLRIYAHFHGDLYTYHSIYDGGKLADILADVSAFLIRAPEEVVVLKFRSYADRDRESTLSLVTSVLGGKLYKADAIPNFASQPLSSFKGKVIAVFTPDYDSYIKSKDNVFPYRDYGNEDTGVATPPVSNDCFGVYDSYSHRSEFDLMETDQLAKLEAHGGYGKKYLHLLSWTLTGSTDNVLDLKLLSGFANPQLAKALHAIVNDRKKMPNIVYLDYVDPYLCKRIIDLSIPPSAPNPPSTRSLS